MGISKVFKRILAAGLMLAVLAPLQACTTNAATGRSQLNVLSREKEIAIGNEAGPQFLEKGGGELGDRVIVEYVNSVGKRMAALSEQPDLPWEFHVLDSDVINAFALPGGKVFISRGLLARMTNEAQLAGVLGHEIGHVTARHANDRFANQILVAGAVAGVTVAAGQSENKAVQIGAPLASSIAAGLWSLSYGRGQEHEADSLGLRYMTRAGYDPMGQVQVMQILDKASEGPRQPEFLSTHPDPGSRVDQLKEIIAAQYAHTQNNANFTLAQAPFQKTVLARLEALPAPKHSAEEAAAAAAS